MELSVSMKQQQLVLERAVRAAQRPPPFWCFATRVEALYQGCSGNAVVVGCGPRRHTYGRVRGKWYSCILNDIIRYVQRMKLDIGTRC
jgi:hypothetical protein